MPDSVKRQYRSPQREAAAKATRARIREAAQELFVQQGYVATTMRDVAKRAGVGERTLYDAFPSKVALFNGVLGVRIVDGEVAVPFVSGPLMQDALAEPDPAAMIRALAGINVMLFDQFGDLIMVSVEAAGADPDMRMSSDAGGKATHQMWLTVTRELDSRGALRPGLTAQVAADIMYALTSPHTHQLLRRHRGWSSRRYGEWLEKTLLEQLLGDGG